jgi:hypothetical protein
MLPSFLIVFTDFTRFLFIPLFHARPPLDFSFYCLFLLLSPSLLTTVVTSYVLLYRTCVVYNTAIYVAQVNYPVLLILMLSLWSMKSQIIGCAQASGRSEQTAGSKRRTIFVRLFAVAVPIYGE